MNFVGHTLFLNSFTKPYTVKNSIILPSYKLVIVLNANCSIKGNCMKILKIHTLDKGWCDKDYIMLHAAFQILVDFVEKEKPDQ